MRDDFLQQILKTIYILLKPSAGKLYEIQTFNLFLNT